jgi:hypothetical protein
MTQEPQQSIYDEYKYGVRAANQRQGTGFKKLHLLKADPGNVTLLKNSF